MTNVFVRFLRATAAEWTAANPVLEAGRQGYETDTRRAKVGDGTTAWTSLAYSYEAGGGGISDGDKGDITVSSGGATWTIDNGAVTLAKQANMATASLVYRKTAGTGAPEVQSLATLKADLGLTGTNSGDQTTIVGITGTKAQFDTAVTDGNFLYVGDVTTNATHTGDATGDTSLTLATVNANVGSFGSATQAGTFTVNGKGLVTAAGNATISVPATAISDSTAAGRAMVTAASATAQTALLDVATSSVKGLAPASGGGTTNFLRADLTWAAPAGGGSATPVDIQEFSTVGSSTWTKPAGARLVHLLMFSGGNGGGSGRLRADTTTASGGGGGGGAGSRLELMLPASMFGATETVVVGAGGTGGAARSSTSDGATGGNASPSTFGSITAYRGSGGGGGTVAGGGGGFGGTSTTGEVKIDATSLSAIGGPGAAGAAGGAGRHGGFRAGGGGGGSGFAAAATTANNGGAGGLGGAALDTTTSQTGGGGTFGTGAGGSGGAGAASANNYVGGSGGGGGANGQTTANGGNGGNGGYPGGGGGGGGSATVPFSSGAGGNGADGFVRVTTFF